MKKTKPVISFTKTVQQSEECFIQFDKDELDKMGLRAGDKFSCKLLENGSVELKKFAEIAIDLGELRRDVLEQIVAMSIENQVSADVIMVDALKKMLPELAKECGIATDSTDR